MTHHPRTPSGSTRRRIASTSLAALAVLLAAERPATAQAGACERLSAPRLSGGQITAARVVAAGGFVAPGGGASAEDGFQRLPAFCRVEVTLRPSADSDIKVEVWLPATDWNQKLQVVGNGGWAGSISYGAMAQALARGYATSSTDTGHTGASARFALGHPEKLIDYAYRSEHEMTVAAKAIVGAHYGRTPAYSYFNGCSTGGRQALIEAQRYPDDFDGIIAGAAANPKVGLDSWRMWMAQAMLKNQASFIPPSKYPVIHRAVLDACDGLDGVTDGLLENPLQCRFDPKVLACQGPDGPGCLTPTQLEAAAVVMGPAKDRKTGALIFPGFALGTELGWGRLLGGPEAYDTAVDQFKYIVFGDPKWDWRTFELERDMAASQAAANGVLAGVNPDLTAFARRGGKLLTYHGWADQSIAPEASINFYKSALAATTPPSGSPEWLRLFMVPGMGHCSGGDGPDTFDKVSALEAWVERGQPPERIVASRIVKGKAERTRPLCAYPKVARYSGTGSIDDEKNFACLAP
jgi:feruloyl esterase